jgi:hypothetical protein
MKCAEIAGEMAYNSRSAQALVMPTRSSPVPVVKGDHDMADTSLANSPLGPFGLAFRLAEAAAAWNVARVESARLRKERAAILCENEAAYEAKFTTWEESGRVGAPPSNQSTPCWKSREDPDGLMPLDEQCDACQRRYGVHQQLVKANIRRGARLRVLQRYAADYAAAVASSIITPLTRGEQ